MLLLVPLARSCPCRRAAAAQAAAMPLLLVLLPPCRRRCCRCCCTAHLCSLKLLGPYLCVVWPSRFLGRLMIMMASKGHFCSTHVSSQHHSKCHTVEHTAANNPLPTTTPCWPKGCRVLAVLAYHLLRAHYIMFGPAVQSPWQHPAAKWHHTEVEYAHLSMPVHIHGQLALPANPVGGPLVCAHCKHSKPRCARTLTQIPQPMHSSSEIHASLLVLLTSMHSLPAHIHTTACDHSQGVTGPQTCLAHLCVCVLLPGAACMYMASSLESKFRLRSQTPSA
jgi:hypothetical protein